jgi:hypothetical protein
MPKYEADDLELNDLDAVADRYEEEADYVAAACPVCGGQGALLGDLGRLTWFRCVACGMDFARHQGGS